MNKMSVSKTFYFLGDLYMINLNKLFMSVVVTATIVNAEEADVFAALTASGKKAVAYVSDYVASIDTEDVQKKAVVVEEKIERFFQANPLMSLALGSFFVGKGLVHYKNSNNVAKYINNNKYPMATLSKDAASQIENGTQQLKDTFVRHCKKAGRRNAVIGAGLLSGYVFYNHIKKGKNVIVDNNKINTLFHNTTEASI
jgi:hypothetical protein